MATTIASYDFAARDKRGAHYPWATWFDGQIWRLSKGVDFSCEPDSFRSAAWHAKRAFGREIRTAIEGNDVVIQAVG